MDTSGREREVGKWKERERYEKIVECTDIVVASEFKVFSCKIEASWNFKGP